MEECGELELAEQNSERSNEKAKAVQFVRSSFTGGAFANFFMALAARLATILSLGIAYPFMVCWRERWVASHTYINGKRLKFDGNGAELIGKYIIWWLLSIVTLGIYWLVAVALRLEGWKTKHTHFTDENETESATENGSEPESKFTGSCLAFLGIRLLANLVTVITLSFGAYWAHCFKQRYIIGNKVIDGKEFDFNGKGIQFFGKCICWVLLTLVTFGIYSFWLTVKVKKWSVLHTNTREALAIAAELGVAVGDTDEKAPKVAKGFVFSVAGFLLVLLQDFFKGAVLDYFKNSWHFGGYGWLFNLLMQLGVLAGLGLSIAGLVLNKKDKALDPKIAPYIIIVSIASIVICGAFFLFNLFARFGMFRIFL